jgi:signal transduction histidine kinase
MAIGFVCTLLLAVVTIGAALIELTRVEHTALGTADEIQQSAYALGEVGEQLARLRAHVALGIRETPEEFSQRSEQISRIDGLLTAALQAVPGALEPSTRQYWVALQTKVAALRQAYADAASAIRAGKPVRAAELLARDADAESTLHDLLDDLSKTQRESVLTRLRSAHHEAAQLGVFELILAGGFLVGLVVIWSIMFGMLRRQNRSIAEYTARLESVNSDLDAFAGRVAHDLKNALSPAAMAPALLRRSPTDPERVLEIANRAERSSQRAIALVDALLAFSRASRTADSKESSALEPAVRQVLEELSPLMERLDVSVEAEDIPDVEVRCSPGLLHIVLANVCGNAVKYLQDQEERRVRVSAHVEDSACRIDIDDTGPGIPEQAQDKIFDPFYRVDGSRVAGTGIGLATVRRIVDARGGRITLDSSTGHGCRFHVWLPLASPRQPAVAASAAPRSARPPAQP